MSSTALAPSQSHSHGGITEEHENDAASRRSSHDMEKAESPEPEQPPVENDFLSRASTRRSRLDRTESRRGSLPVGFQAGLGESNLNRTAELELQRLKSQRNAEDGKPDDPDLVEWSGPDDPGNPKNWPEWKKWTITIALGIMTFVATFASSVFSTATVAAAQEYHVSNEVMTLGTSLFVAGYSVGPLFWAPASETFGRKIPIFIGYSVFAIFQIPVAVARNVETIMLGRFFGGCFAAAPLVIIGGTLADFFGPTQLGVAMCLFAGATFVGPGMGPIIGGFITQSHLGWRWTAWITLIMCAFFGILAFIIVPESYAPVLLQRRARRIRYETRNWAVHSKHDEKEVNIAELASKYFTRPIFMLVQEPILIAMTIYLSLIYGIIYLFFEVFPISFQEERGWNGGVGSLPFLSLFIGVVLALSWAAYDTRTRYAVRLAASSGRVVPEQRLIPMMVGAFLLPAGLFWFAWTSSPHISPWPQIIAIAPIGAGVVLIFMQGLVYLIDCYLMYANSAIAANTIVRSLVGAGFPLFATGMFHNLGVPWATSLLAFLCVAMIPVPVLFFWYGEKIRGMSRFSPH